MRFTESIIGLHSLTLYHLLRHTVRVCFSAFREAPPAKRQKARGEKADEAGGGEFKKKQLISYTEDLGAVGRKNHFE